MVKAHQGGDRPDAPTSGERHVFMRYQDDGPPGLPPDLNSLRRRIDRMRAEEREEAARETGGKALSGWGMGFRLSTEFVAAIIVGGGMGWLIDGWLDTRPWAFILCFLFGMAAGVLNVTRAAARMNRDAREDED